MAKQKATAKTEKKGKKGAIGTTSQTSGVTQGKGKVNCVDCKWYSIEPMWFGPHCSNPASPFYRKRVREEGTCEEGEARVLEVTLPMDVFSVPDSGPDTGVTHETGVFDDGGNSGQEGGDAPNK